MPSIINSIRLALGIVPDLIALVKAVELPGSGPAKAAAVVDLVKAALDLVPEELSKIAGADKVLGFARKAIDIIVALMNAAGVFRKAEAQA